jgi:hypothetical protein
MPDFAETSRIFTGNNYKEYLKNNNFMKTLRIAVRSLHNEEWFNLHTDLAKMIKRFGSAAVGLGELYDAHEPLYQKADKLLQTIRKSIYTLDMEAADKKRGDVFKGFFSVVKGSQKQLDPAKNRAALKVFNLLDEYRKSILHGSYSEESAALYNLLQDLGGAYASDISLLGFADWVAALRQTEKDFLDARSERLDESFAKPKEKLRLVRSETDAVYTAMLHVLDARLLAAGLGGDTVVNPEDLDTDAHGDGEHFEPEKHGNITYNFVIEWNEALKKYRDLLQQRAGRRAKEKEDGDVSEDNTD